MECRFINVRLSCIVLHFFRKNASAVFWLTSASVMLPGHDMALFSAYASRAHLLVKRTNMMQPCRLS